MSQLLTERLIQRQINHWNRLRDYLVDNSEEPRTERRPVVTVSRLAGSGGRRLAEALAQRLDLRLHDQSLVDRIARDNDLRRSAVAQLDERTVSQVQLWVQGILQQRIFMRDEYHAALVEAVTTLAARGGCVFLGRGANLILGDSADLRLRVIAPFALRVDRLCARSGLEPDKAGESLRMTDEQRASFVRKVFGEEPGAAENYDLVLNAASLDLEAMVDHAALHLARRVPQLQATL